MSTLTSKFSIGDRAYYAVFSTATIYSVQILDVIVAENVIQYKIMRADDPKKIFTNVDESTLRTFSEAKSDLLAYLSAKILAITNLVAP